MKPLWLVWTASAVLSAAPATAPDTQPADDPRVDQLLRDVEARGKVIQTLEARLTRTLIMRLWDNRTTVSTGRLLFQRPDRFRIDIEGPRRESYICDGSSVFEMQWRTRQIVEHTIPDAQRGRFLDRPPVNFLIGGPAAEAKKLFFIRVLDDNERTITLELKPQPDNKEADFLWARLTFDKKDLIPVRVHRELRQRRETEEIHQFDHIRINGGLKPAEFQRPERPGPGWTWEKDPAGKPEGGKP